MLDYFQISDLLTDEERQVSSSARDFLDAEFKPGIRDWWEEGVFPKELVPKLGEMGYLGPNFPTEYGASGVNNMARSHYVRVRVRRFWPANLRKRSGRSGNVPDILLWL